MYFLIILLIFSEAGHVVSKNAGSTLFYHMHDKSDCWSEDDIAKLRARKTFEDLVPLEVNPDSVNDKYIKETLKYLRNAMKCVEKHEDSHTSFLLKQALSDTIGAHLRRELLPPVRFAYYAGYINYRHARRVHNFYDEIKNYLNTQGLGWKQPERVPRWTNLTVAKISIGSGKLLNPCECLITKRDSNSCIHLPSPRLDDDRSPSAIALPFRTDGLISLQAPRAENILLKYYTTASRCILQSSPQNCRHTDFVTFNNELWHWMKRDVAPHLVDEKLYVAYGGVLRIAAAVQNYGKGLSRRNLYQSDQLSATKWMPWKSLTEANVYIDADWTPGLYVGLVFLAAVAICLLQFCYNYIFGDKNHCNCGLKRSMASKVACANIETNSPVLVPHQSAIYFNEKKRNRNASSRSKTSSLGSIQTQKVYDLNENAEKLMAVIMSDNESETESSSKSSDMDGGHDHVVDAGNDPRPKSPPKIETSIAQLKIEKATCSSKAPSLPLYSTTTLTRSDATYFRDHQLSESVWSGTGSSSSSRTGSSTSSHSKILSRRTKSSRDLAWARHVIAKSSGKITKSTSGTDLNLNSLKASSKR